MPGGSGQEHTMPAPERGGPFHVPGLLPVSGIPTTKTPDQDERTHADGLCRQGVQGLQEAVGERPFPARDSVGGTELADILTEQIDKRKLEKRKEGSFFG